MAKKEGVPWNAFIITALIFLMTQFLGLLVGHRLFNQGLVEYIEPGTSLISFFVAFAIAIVLIFLFLNIMQGKFIHLFFAFAIFIGTQTVFSAYFPIGLATALAIFIVLIRYLKPSIITQNLAISLTVAGIGASLGLMFSVPVVLFLLVALSYYDIIAVYKTKHMLTMFNKMMEKGVILSLVVPERLKDLTASQIKYQKKKGKRKKSGAKFFMLGTGDITFPIIFAVSALQHSIFSSLFIIAGAFVGLLFDYYIIIKTKEPIPALPPIALFSMIGLIIALLLF